jgi:hypothetical protein
MTHFANLNATVIAHAEMLLRLFTNFSLSHLAKPKLYLGHTGK